VDDVGVPAVIGFHGSDEVLNLANTIFIPRGVMAVAALNHSPLLRDIPHPPGSPRMVWRVAGSSARTAPVTAALVSDWLEPALRRQGVLPMGAEMHVALLRSDSSAARAVADMLVSYLRFNGKSVVDNGGLFRDFPVAEPPAAGDHEAVGAQVAEFAPDVVVYVWNASGVDVIDAIERRWPHARAHGPYYVDEGGSWEGEVLARITHRDPSLRRRMLSVMPAAWTEPNVRFVQRFNAISPQKATPADAPNASYDAFYLLAYGAAAVRDEPLTGEALARAVPALLPPAPRIEVGAAGVLPALRALAAGEHMDLDGASGRLDFDVTTGETEHDFDVLCVGAEGTGGLTGGVESGLVYDAVTKTFHGRLRCP
jgi:hypothetical protein